MIPNRILDVIRHGQLNLLKIKIYLRYQYIMERRWSTIQPILTKQTINYISIKKSLNSNIYKNIYHDTCRSIQIYVFAWDMPQNCVGLYQLMESHTLIIGSPATIHI